MMEKNAAIAELLKNAFLDGRDLLVASDLGHEDTAAGFFAGAREAVLYLEKSAEVLPGEDGLARLQRLLDKIEDAGKKT